MMVLKEDIGTYAQQRRGLPWILFAGVLLLIPVLHSGYFVFKNGVNVLFLDEVDMAEFLIKVFNGQGTFSDWFAFHNEHRILFPRLVFVALAFLSGFSSKAEMYFTQGLFIVNLGILFLFFRKRFNLRQQILWFVPVAFLVFHMRQWQNMLWGFQLSFTMPITFALISFLLADRLSKKTGLRAQLPLGFLILACATVASFSSATGLMVWPAVIIQAILCCKDTRGRWEWTAIFGLLAVLQWVLYFYGFIRPPGHPSWSVVIKNPVLFTEYFFVSLGAIFQNRNIAFATGCIACVLYLLTMIRLWRTGRLWENGFFIGVTLFSLAALLSIAIGRAGAGIEQALSSRYTSFSLYFYIGLYLANIPKPGVEKATFDRAVVVVLLAILYLSVISAYSQGSRIGREYLVSRSYMGYLLRNHDLAPDDYLLYFHPDSKDVRQVAEMLDIRQWNAFLYDDVPGNPLAGKKALSNDMLLNLDGNFHLITEKAVVIEGAFTIDMDNGQGAGAVYMRIMGEYYPAFYVERWGDMPRYSSNLRPEYPGYFGLLPRDAFLPGNNSIEIIVLTRDRQAYYAPKTVLITIPD